MLQRHGHSTSYINDYAPKGSPDPLVATVAEELVAILISLPGDGDFEKIAPRVLKGQRMRFRKLSRIRMRCGEPQAAKRLETALDLVATEFSLAQKRSDSRMMMTVGKSYLRTDR